MDHREVIEEVRAIKVLLEHYQNVHPAIVNLYRSTHRFLNRLETEGIALPEKVAHGS